MITTLTCASTITVDPTYGDCSNSNNIFSGFPLFIIIIMVGNQNQNYLATRVVVGKTQLYCYLLFCYSVMLIANCNSWHRLHAQAYILHLHLLCWCWLSLPSSVQRWHCSWCTAQGCATIVHHYCVTRLRCWGGFWRHRWRWPLWRW